MTYNKYAFYADNLSFYKYRYLFSDIIIIKYFFKISMQYLVSFVATLVDHFP